MGFMQITTTFICIQFWVEKVAAACDSQRLVTDNRLSITDASILRNYDSCHTVMETQRFKFEYVRADSAEPADLNTTILLVLVVQSLTTAAP